MTRQHAGAGHGYWPGHLERHVVELFYLTVLVLGAEQRLALALEPKRRGLSGLDGGVNVGVQRQNPCLRQQRAREAEQQQQGNMGAQGLHGAKMG